jgi:polysaccharide export outer membrane protein
MTSALYLLSVLLFQTHPVATELPPATQEASPDGATIYTIGAGDDLLIRAIGLEEFDGKPVRVDIRGDLNLPMVGRIHAAGRTLEDLQKELAARLKKFLTDPDVTVSLGEMRSQPVSVLGAVQTPGVHQLQGEKTLFEVLSLAGGLRPDAGNTVKITRRLNWGRIPLRNAADDSTGRFSVASVGVKSILAGANPEENIEIKPNDVISVPRADLIYVIGAVKKAGGFVLGENESLSALQVLSLAEGMDRTAAPQEAKIMRTVEGNSNRAEIPVNLKKILAGKGTDVPLKANDILFIPTSATKNAALRTLEAAVQIGTGLAIYR